MIYISWTGTIFSILGAFIVAFGYMLPGYSAFLIGAVSWLAVGVSRRDNALICLNSVFLVANLVGFWRAL